MEDDEPMAIIRWEFPSEAWPDLKISGSAEIRALSCARQIAEKLNAEYGEGSHWVEPLNHTWAEKHLVRYIDG